MMGISKRELMEEYYIDEIREIIRAWNRLHGAEDEEAEVDAMTFFGDGGERVGAFVGG